MGIIGIVMGLVGGAGLMYLFDPRMGKRRRAVLRDQVVKARHKTDDRLDAAREDLANRAQGIAAEARSHLADEPVPDDTLAERVRSAMGVYVSHPGAIDISVHQGVVSLRGAILTKELQPFVAAVTRLRGVQGVNNELQAYASGEGIPDLQGGVTRTGLR